jgi:hypothetical protein
LFLYFYLFNRISNWLWPKKKQGNNEVWWECSERNIRYEERRQSANTSIPPFLWGC